MEGIAYQNKDVASKSLAEGMKDKSLNVYGIKLPKIVEVLPTNLPVVEANELRLDNLFRFEDGSYGIVDYESQFDENDKITYLNYVARVAKRFLEQGISAKLHMIVLYTCNVKRVNTKLDIGCLQLDVEPGYLCSINSEETVQEIKAKIHCGQLLDDSEMMKMIVLPLTREEREEQKIWLKRTIDLAKSISDARQQLFVLSGILTFSDKIIENDYAEEIRGWIMMTKVAKLFEIEKEEAINAVKAEMQMKLQEAERERQEAEREKQKAVNRENVFKMLLKGNEIIDISRATGISEEEIRELLK